ncbi:MAG TPA: hypothetical protein VLJ58_07115, partial [Ramlibacter sp.]|nr:hypothetical protein [Ramlibacter sp.]
APAPSAPVLALADALLQAAAALPGFVQHDVADHARLLHDGPVAGHTTGSASRRTPRRSTQGATR